VKKIVKLVVIALFLFCFFAPSFQTSAAAVYEVYIENTEGNNLTLSAGNYKEAYAFALEKEKEDQNNNVVIYADGKVVYATYALVNFRTKASSGVTTNYTIEFNGKSGYTNGYYGADAAFLGTNEDGTQVRFMQAGVIGWVNANEVEILNMNSDSYQSLYTSVYSMIYTDTWELRHYVALDVRNYKSVSQMILGQERPEGMANKTNYLSYDGHYFYPENLEGYRAMMRDYKNGVRTSSINPNNPYYNYYQFLSHRSISNYTSAQIKQNLSMYTSKPTSFPVSAGQSQLFGEEISFIQYQNEFGANAIMMLGTAKNESGNGTSNIAVNKNNLFGHSAFDSSPGASANGYVSVAQSIYAHAKRFISETYLDPCDSYTVNGNGTSDKCHNGKYYGGNLGDKSSGMNVKYASDPYWGEKAAANYYSFDKHYGLQDYGKYSIGIKTTADSYPVKAEPNNNSVTLYMTGKSNNYAITVLESVVGEEINGNNIWYKIQSDPTLNQTRTGILQDQGAYNFEQNIAYIHSSYINFLRKGKDFKSRYTIQFNPNGGKFTDNITSTKSLTIEEYVIPEINEPIRDGYIFKGWDKEIVGATENTTYTAIWEATVSYNVTFDANGGKFTDGSTTKTVKVDKDQIPIFSLTPSKEGYIFIGWDRKFEATTANTTYMAVYTEIEMYEITFDANGGEFVDQTSTKKVLTEKGKKPVISMEPNKENAIFVGWDEEITVATKNTTYKAKYKNILDADDLEELKLNDSFFYLDSIQSKNGKLHVKGFQTIEGIDNNLNIGIQYLIVLIDLENPEKIYIKNARRIKDVQERPFPSYGLSNKDYSYAWFELETDFDGVSDGNYIAGVMAYTNHEYSVSILNNKMFAPQATNYTGKKEVIIRNIYYDNLQPVEFVVRSNKIADRTTNTYTYNQFDQFFELDFTSNNLLHIKGYTYSYGMDLKSSANVKRNIIFENIETFEKTVFSLNAVKGAYDPALPESDSLSKTLAWYDGNIDISKLEKGVYYIYLSTASNISDVSELKDLFNQDLSGKSKIINGKRFDFITIGARGNIVVLSVS